SEQNVYVSLIPSACKSVCEVFIVLFFFFSSRRRHTRSYGDWSSHVCSSDLSRCAAASQRAPTEQVQERHADRDAVRHLVGDHRRSEERRVGKECRSRWWPEH